MAEHPRITRPFSDEAWAELNALGHKVDQVLAAGDVRLTMGGEPTFVSIDDFEAAEWNSDAVGPMKRDLADKLIRRLRDRFAPGGFLHYGQGKWYPGESLPRWTFSLYWRRDGQPVWKNPELVAREAQDYAADADQAHDFMATFAEKLGIAHYAHGSVIHARNTAAGNLAKFARLGNAEAHAFRTRNNCAAKRMLRFLLEGRRNAQQLICLHSRGT